MATPPPPPAAAIKPKSSAMEALEDIIYGSVSPPPRPPSFQPPLTPNPSQIAGIVGKYIEYPFDTVKVRLQSQPSHLPLLYTGPLDCFRQSLRSDGLASLYRGISAPLFGAAIETSSLFFFERLGRDAVLRLGLAPRQDAPLPLPALWFTGAFAGVFTSFLLTPIELVKCKIQVPATSGGGLVALRPLPVIRDIFRHQGLRGFWRGQLGTLIREAGGCAAWFGSKETASKFMRDGNVRAAVTEEARRRAREDPLPLWQQAVAGASAGMSYNFLFFPADTVKSRMQTTPLGEVGGGRGFGAEAAVLWREAGVKGFYRGCGVTVLRSAPSSAFIFMVFDGMKKYLPMQ